MPAWGELVLGAVGCGLAVFALAVGYSLVRDARRRCDCGHAAGCHCYPFDCLVDGCRCDHVRHGGVPVP